MWKKISSNIHKFTSMTNPFEFTWLREALSCVRRFSGNFAASERANFGFNRTYIYTEMTYLSRIYKKKFNHAITWSSHRSAVRNFISLSDISRKKMLKRLRSRDIKTLSFDTIMTLRIMILCAPFCGRKDPREAGA